MNNAQRKEEIIKLRATHTLEELASRFSLSRERIRQIIEGKQEFELEKRLLLQKKYKKNINKLLTPKKLLAEIQRLSVQDRRKEIVFQRAELVKILSTKYKFNNTQLAFLFSRDRASIINLLRPKKLKCL